MNIGLGCGGGHLEVNRSVELRTTWDWKCFEEDCTCIGQCFLHFSICILLFCHSRGCCCCEDVACRLQEYSDLLPIKCSSSWLLKTIPVLSWLSNSGIMKIGLECGLWIIIEYECYILPVLYFCLFFPCIRQFAVTAINSLIFAH